MKNKKFNRPFRVSVFRDESETSVHSYETFKLAVEKHCELIPIYFNVKKHPYFEYSIVITKFSFNKKNQVIRKRLLTTKRQPETK